MEIRKLYINEKPPLDLLLLADPSEEMIQRYLHKSDSYVAEIDGKVVGIYVLLLLAQDSVEIVNLAVYENFQGKGIGEQLIAHAIQTARHLGFKTIEIGTGNSSIGQLALYQKCGFRVDHIEKDYFTKNYMDEIYENGIRCRDMIRLKQDL